MRLISRPLLLATRVDCHKEQLWQPSRMFRQIGMLLTQGQLIGRAELNNVNFKSDRSHIDCNHSLLSSTLCYM